MRLEFMSENDAKKIAEFEEKAGYKDGYSESVLSSALKREEGYYLAAYEKDLVALISFSVSGDCSDIEEVLVFPSERKKGYALKLLERTEEFLVKKGVKKIFLEVRKSNIPAKNLYIKFGFNKISERKKYYSDGEDAEVFIKEIL